MLSRGLKSGTVRGLVPGRSGNARTGRAHTDRGCVSGDVRETRMISERRVALKARLEPGGRPVD